MPFIGVVAKESDSNFIKKEVLRNAEKNKFDIININRQNIENIKNIKFDTVVINDDFIDFLNTSKYLEDIVKNSKFLVLNSDILNKVNLPIEQARKLDDFFYEVKNVNLQCVGELENNEAKVITYGLNQKAAITMSSIKSENILICVQKRFKNYYGKIVEEQEVNVEITKNNLKKISNSMAIFTILTIYGEKLKKI